MEYPASSPKAQRFPIKYPAVGENEKVGLFKSSGADSDIVPPNIHVPFEI